ncbi:MAG: malto-oligosyltrehalose trehalohydrolase [Alphaproteobacteria bacterium]|nr:malto-oligosyltrehalose trehalohydrolase [Alphaproteobacteria bacterium]
MTDRFACHRSWGAEPLDGASDTRFRLWAPGVDELRLVFGNRGEELPMDRVDDGWFETATGRVAPGDAYAFRLPNGTAVPDPAARAQRDDVHGASLLVDPRAYAWRTASWQGRPWEEAVIYELHTGAFTAQGTFGGIEGRLDHLAETGITAIELMPVAQFGGNRGWGYDGVLLYAPHRAYGGPDGLKALVDEAHARGLMVLLDVVYNHFGPDGNYLHLYAPEFFDKARQTPWGAAIAYDRPAVRAFFVENALYWLEEYRFDGLRLDAINEIRDPSPEHILETIAATVRARIADRHIHLTTEDDRNITRLHERDANGAVRAYTAEWNDDFHHAAHVIATGEAEGYYIDYAEGAAAGLARGLAEGFIFQGEVSEFWGDAPRGAPSAHMPPPSFVSFIQNHDQIGNRAFNERLTDLAPARVVEALTAILLLAPHIPLLFMGEEWGETAAFGFFTDFHGELADAVREGRRREFRRFARFADEANRERIPDPNAESTFLASRLDWRRMDEPAGRERHALVARLLRIRREEIVPRLRGIAGHAGKAETGAGRAFGVRWRLGDGATLTMLANPGDDPCKAPMTARGRVLYESTPGIAADGTGAELPAWSVAVSLADAA